jgi:pimeloyl-ACP methyl ester carboxylesterase
VDKDESNGATTVELSRRTFIEQAASVAALSGISLFPRLGDVETSLQQPAAAPAAADAAKRREYLEKLLNILPPAPAFNDWLKASGELPPDFDALPRVNGLPDPFRFVDGREVKTAADWQARRREIGDLYQKYQLGTFPPRPKINRAIVLDETRGEGYLIRNVRLEFGPHNQGTMRVRLILPNGTGPFRVLVCNSLAGWGPALIRRNYISCGYAANDFMDDAAPLDKLYPDYSFALLPRRAWAAGIVLDYLETLPQVDMKRIGIFGYSRDGKVAAIAAAFDQRIAAVIAGSTGVGGVLSWRSAGESRFAESIESDTREFPTWFLMRLRFFCGREDRLPIDGNLLVAMIAPRSCLIEYGLNDQVSNSYGDERTYDSALKVYQRLGHPERLGIFRLPGFHGANDEERDLDWLDIQLGRSSEVWSNDRLFPWSFDAWRTQTHQEFDLSRYPEHRPGDILTARNGALISSVAAWEAKAAEVRESVAWMLGGEPAMLPPGADVPAFLARFRNLGARRGPAQSATAVSNPGQVSPRIHAWVIQQGGNAYGWLEPQKSQTASRPLNFGYGVKGTLYYPKDTPAGKKLPAAIWLHGLSYPLGYMWVYHFNLHPILALVQAGYAVLAYDQSGFGTRMSETGPFYQRYPQWSCMGRLVEDARMAAGALQGDEAVDPERISIFGYGLGGLVGLYAAALDPRIKSLVSICGFTPMRTDTADKGAGGLARYSYECGLVPRLGFFVGHENRVPYDYHDLMGLIAPRPAMIVQPVLDRDANPADVHASVAQASEVYRLYAAADKLNLWEPWDYSRLPDYMQDKAIQWMGQA